MTDRIVFDIFNKDKNQKKKNNERDADEIKISGAIITTDKKIGTKGKKTITQTDIWNEGAEIKALEGATMEDMPAHKKSTGKFINTKKKNVNWNKPLNTIKEGQSKPATKIGTWGAEPRKSSWNEKPKIKSTDFLFYNSIFIILRFKN